jgi:hypothetical protein
MEERLDAVCAHLARSDGEVADPRDSFLRERPGHAARRGKAGQPGHTSRANRMAQQRSSE